MTIRITIILAVAVLIGCGIWLSTVEEPHWWLTALWGFASWGAIRTVPSLWMATLEYENELPRR